MEPEGEWTFEGGPKIIVGADGDPARYHRSAYDGMRQSGSLDQFGWHREGISSQASQDAWDFFHHKSSQEINSIFVVLLFHNILLRPRRCV